MLEFMQTLRVHAGRDPGSVEVFLSTHPSPADRVERLRAQLRRVRAGGRHDSAEFDRIHATLARMAPARAMPKR
jgi:predicted Zn-dependent protease